jgi:gliding motility-associated-like protein
MIFNRWGEMVFFSEDYNYGWNGSWNNNGDLCPDGVYIWKINYTDASGRSQKETGHLTLIR